MKYLYATDKHVYYTYNVLMAVKWTDSQTLFKKIIIIYICFHEINDTN